VLPQTKSSVSPDGTGETAVNPGHSSEHVEAVQVA
jgi:hypothetical protein